MAKRSIAQREELDLPDRTERDNDLQRRYIEKVKIPEFFNKYQGEVFSEKLLYLLQEHLGDYKRKQNRGNYTLEARWSDWRKTSISILYNDKVICTLTN